MASPTRIHLFRDMFAENERELVSAGDLTASVFRYSSGVAALRVTSNVGSAVFLPFQGQQIWDVQMLGRILTMKSMFDEPAATTEYLRTYGAFLLHCGFTAMGVPAEGDDHPLHGELPNAAYQHAYLEVGEDEEGSFMVLGGTYQHTVAFSHNYIAEPRVRMGAESSVLRISISLTNLKKTPMEYLYLAHVNFRPEDNGRLVYSAHCDTSHVRVRSSIPSHVKPDPAYMEFLASLEAHPAAHNELAPGLAFDPEVVFFIDYEADQEGWAHTMQLHPDGFASYIRHRPGELDKGIRWISRTPDQDALGMLLPATAEPEGVSAERAKGNIRILPAGQSVGFHYDAGLLAPEETKAMEKKIRGILG